MTFAFVNLSQKFLRPSGDAMRLRKMIRSSRTPCSSRHSTALMADPPVAVGAMEASCLSGGMEMDGAGVCKRQVAGQRCPRATSETRLQVVGISLYPSQRSRPTTHPASGPTAAPISQQCRLAFSHRSWSSGEGASRDGGQFNVQLR